MDILTKFGEMSSDVQKIQDMFFILPLITFIFYDLNIILISIYTFSLAIHLVYVHFMRSFSSFVLKDIILGPKKGLKSFWYLPNLWLFLVIASVNILGFLYSFYISYTNYNPLMIYNRILFLLHIFIATINIFMMLFITIFKKNIPLEIKNKIKGT